MKKLVVLTLCIAVVLGCSQKRPEVIERPVFETVSSTMLEIDKIVMTDSATVFHLDAFGRQGGWIHVDENTYIRESGSDEKLMLISSEGVNIGERTTIPESGTIAFKLFFPPLRANITKIDYIEDIEDAAAGWKIMEIHLLPNAKIKFDPIPKDVSKITAESLPTPGFIAQPIQVNGRMLGYVEGVGSDKVTIYTTNVINGDRNETEFAIAADGSFSGEIMHGLTGITYSSMGNLFLTSDKDLKIYTDLKKRSRYQSRYRTDKEPGDSIYTYISGGFTNAELDAINKAALGMFDYQKLAQETVEMSPEAFKQHILNIMNKQLDEQKQHNYSANTQMMVENNIKMSAFSFLMQYESFMNFAYAQVNNIKPEDRNKITFKPEKPDDDYYSFLKGELTDEMSYLPPFLSLTASLERLYGMPDANDKSAEERFAYFKDKITPVLGKDEGILFDLVKVKYYGAQLGDMKFFTDAEKQEIRKVFSDKPALADILIAENDKTEALIAANKDNKECILNENPQVAKEKMFDAILANYKGKVVLVDFWATWCGPCMVAMKSMLPMKDEMKGKDVVFLYLTGETSPLAKFTQTYPTITGEHYYVSGEQWNYWMKTYEIPGIPTYMIYDRQGKLISRHLGFPGVDEIRKSIAKGL